MDDEMQALLAQVRESAPALVLTLRRVDELAKSGALDTLLDLAQVAHAARVSMSDVMIHRFSETARVFGELADTLATAGAPQNLPALLQAVAEARAEALADQRSVGIVTLVRALKQPQTQLALKFMLALAGRLPGAAQ